MHDTPAPKWQRVIARIAVVIVALVAAIVSYGHMEHLARAAGEPFHQIVPLSVDGLVVASSLAAFAARRHGIAVPVMTKLSLSVGLLVSVGANVYVPFLPPEGTAPEPWLRALVAAWPAIALALSFEELLRLRLPAETRVKDVAPATSEGATQGVMDHYVPQELPTVSNASVTANDVEVESIISTAPASEPDNIASASNDGNDTYDRAGSAWDGKSVAPVSASKQYDSDTANLTPQALARKLIIDNPSAWTGKSLGDYFERSESWGRQQLAKAKKELATT